jgi:predicted Zn-dependent protease
LRILQNLALALKDRNWTEVENAINQAEQALPESIQVPILRAEVLAGQNKLKEAQALLEGVAAEKHKHAEYWVARAGVADRLEAAGQVVALLDEGEKLLGANVNHRLARIDHWSKLPRAQATALFARQEQELDGWSAADQTRLRDGLANAYYRLEKAADAERLWKEVAAAEGQQNNLHIRFLLLDLALKADDETDDA